MTTDTLTVDSSKTQEAVQRTGVGVYIIYSYRGKFLDNLSREELIQAFKELADANAQLRLGTDDCEIEIRTYD